MPKLGSAFLLAQNMGTFAAILLSGSQLNMLRQVFLQYGSHPIIFGRYIQTWWIFSLPCVFFGYWSEAILFEKLEVATGNHLSFVQLKLREWSMTA